MMVLLAVAAVVMVAVVVVIRQCVGGAFGGCDSCDGDACGGWVMVITNTVVVLFAVIAVVVVVAVVVAVAMIYLVVVRAYMTVCMMGDELVQRTPNGYSRSLTYLLSHN